MKDDFVEMVQHVNNKGVITKMTLGGKEMPLPMGDKPSYCLLQPMEWGITKKMYSKVEAKEIENNLLKFINNN